MFQPGQSGNPKGRPPGTGKRQREERLARERAVSAAEERLSALLGTAIEVVERHLEGQDPNLAANAAQLVFRKVLPDRRHPGNTVNLPELADPRLTLEQKAQLLAARLGEGAITVEQHRDLSRALESQAKIADVQRVEAVIALVRRGVDIREAIARVEEHGPGAGKHVEYAH